MIPTDSWSQQPFLQYSENTQEMHSLSETPKEGEMRNKNKIKKKKKKKKKKKPQMKPLTHKKRTGTEELPWNGQ